MFAVLRYGTSFEAPTNEARQRRFSLDPRPHWTFANIFCGKEGVRIGAAPFGFKGAGVALILVGATVSPSLRSAGQTFPAEEPQLIGTGTEVRGAIFAQSGSPTTLLAAFANMLEIRDPEIRFLGSSGFMLFFCLILFAHLGPCNGDLVA